VQIHFPARFEERIDAMSAEMCATGLAALLRTPVSPRHFVVFERSRVGRRIFVLVSGTPPDVAAPVVLSPVSAADGTSVGEQPARK